VPQCVFSLVTFLSRYRLILFIFLGAVLAIFLFVGGPEPYSLRSFSYVWGLGHFVCFALWTCVYVYLRRSQSFFRVFFEVMVLTFVLGGLVEIVQSFIGRQGSWYDILHNQVGALIGLFFLSDIRRRLTTWLLRTVQVGLVAYVLWAVMPLGMYIIDDVIAWRQFPVFSGFETPFEHFRWQTQLSKSVSTEQAISGNRSLRVVIDPRPYSGIALNGALSDWSGYHNLSLHVYVPDDETMEFFVRVHDQHHNFQRNDRFQQPYQLQKGWNHLLISLEDIIAAPEERKLDITRVAALWLYTMDLEVPRVIYLDDVKLL